MDNNDVTLRALLIPVDGEPTVVDLPAAADKQLARLYELTGATGVECVRVLGVGDLWIDGDGKGRGAPYNSLATVLVGGSVFPGDWIAGDAVLAGRAGAEIAPLAEVAISDVMAAAVEHRVTGS